MDKLSDFSIGGKGGLDDINNFKRMLYVESHNYHI